MGSDRFWGTKLGSGNWFRFRWVRSCEGSRFQRLLSSPVAVVLKVLEVPGFVAFPGSDSGCGFEGSGVPGF